MAMFGLHGSQQFLDQLGIRIELFRYLLIGGLIFTRLFVMTMIIPFMGGRQIPGRVRIALCVALLVVFFFPLYKSSPTTLPDSSAVVFALFLKEMLFGFMLGFTVTMVFYGVQAAGNMIDNQRQLANARIFNPGIGAQASLFGVFYFQLAIVMFLTIGGHRLFFTAVARSFEVVPVLSFPTMVKGLDPLLIILTRLAAETLVISLQLSAPVLIAIFMADLILGLTNRVAPMINVFEMGFNIKGFLGVALVYLGFGLITLQMKTLFLAALEATRRVADFFIR
jgi:Type III secretory pathway, component EscT